MKKLGQYKAPRPRFARSINVERDSGTQAIDGYLPVGRAIDTISRLADALDGDDAEVAISVTGPYGSGKSSLAIVIDALLGPAGDPARGSAEELLGHTAPDALRRLTSARKRLGAEQSGFIRATVTAQREPITATVIRALLHGTERFQAKASHKTKVARIVKRLRAMRSEGDTPTARPTTRDLLEAITDLTQVAPVLLLIDEFGKNLEAFADSQSDADLFLLQELAERTRGRDGLPLALITLQHMAFDEYANSATAVQRREWAKIQGRFEDIPFVDTPAQTRALIAAAFEPAVKSFLTAQRTWAESEQEQLRQVGLGDLAADMELLERCWPLHPIALAVLPELCERYGQNERTLFSFLAGADRRSVASFLTETAWDPATPLPVVRLPFLYDYFLESAAGMIGVSQNASRWLEIDTRVRDAIGISDAGRKVLKTVGLLNLVSAGGALRASRAIVGYVAADGEPGTASSTEVEARLEELEAAGLITFRDFADEYRVWNGSDFDVRSAVELARRRLRDQPADEVMRSVLPLDPVVAARHSHRTGTLRAFERAWVAADAESIRPLGAKDRSDGLLMYVLGTAAPTKALTRTADEKPTVFVTSLNPDRLIAAAREVAAIDEVLSADTDLGDDWVARRELLERRIEASILMEREFHEAFSQDNASWQTKSPRGPWKSRPSPSPSAVLSDVCDRWYADAPVIKNDLVNRHDLSSQAAKARRIVVEAMLSGAHLEGLGIEGFGPDKTLYRSVLRNLHHAKPDGVWVFSDPVDDSTKLQPVWEKIQELIREAEDKRLRITDLYDEIASPPFGVRAGLAPVLLIAALLVGAEDVALYEHGTFRPVLADDIAERLLRNPGNFEVKYYASRTGNRAKYLTAIADALGVEARRGPRNGRVGSVLAVVSKLVTVINGLPEHVKKTQTVRPQTIKVRRALLTATEPDEMLFTDIPTALGARPVPASGNYDASEIARIAEALVEVRDELINAYPTLLNEVEHALREHVGPSCDPLREGLVARAHEVAGKIIDPRVKKLTVALLAEIPDRESWLAYVAMNISGTPPEAWTDDDRDRFFASIAEVGGTFRRIHALNADLDARGEGFDAYRHVMTRTDGTEVVQVIAIDQRIREEAEPIIDLALEELSERLGKTADETRRLLIGVLSEADLAEGSSGSAGPAESVAYSGKTLGTSEGR